MSKLNKVREEIIKIKEWLFVKLFGECELSGHKLKCFVARIDASPIFKCERCGIKYYENKEKKWIFVKRSDISIIDEVTLRIPVQY